MDMLITFCISGKSSLLQAFGFLLRGGKSSSPFSSAGIFYSRSIRSIQKKGKEKVVLDYTTYMLQITTVSYSFDIAYKS